MAVKKTAASTKQAKAAKAAPARKRKPVVEAVAAVATPSVVETLPDPEPAPAVEKAVAVPRKSKTSRYLLPGNMEIQSLGPAQADLVAMEASNDGPFVLDGANLSVIDTAGLQLLISFVSQVKSSGRKVSWDNYSVQAYQLANELGVVDQLGD
jgi:anti-anti-sigma regulatory factor